MAWPKVAAGVIEELKRKIASIQEQGRSTRRENERLREENERLRQREKQWEQERERLRQERERLWQERERLREQNEKLKKQLEEAQRANKRQAAPFSRGQRKANPKPPGRKPGSAYGRRHSKAIPKQVDEVIAVPAPAQCECGGQLEVESIQPQYQQEIVRKTFWRRFDIPICRCTVCQKRVQGRDPRQTSDALGAAAVQLGPDALALAVQMNKGLGMPHADVAAVLQDGFQLRVNRSTICRAVERVARRGEATWHALRDAARHSMVNGIDERGWNVAAQLRWLWVVVSEQVTFCDILPGRGFAQAASLLGADYEGWLTHDGWKVYYKFLRASHQSCNFHLLHRCEDMAKLAAAAAARFPLRVKAWLEEGLALRDRYEKQAISLHGLWTATGRLEGKLDRLLARGYRDSANRRLAKHLRGERPYLFTYLYCPGLDATNNAAERAIRALIGARKNWGGNRTEKGARAQAVLTSILQTAQRQGQKPFDVVVELLCGRDPHPILALVPRSRELSQDSSPGPPPRAAVPPWLPSFSSAEVSLALESVALYAVPASAAGVRAPVQP
jgi:transposase